MSGGELIWRLFNAVLVAAVVGLIAIWRYRRAVAQRMAAYSPGGGAVAVPAGEIASAAPADRAAPEGASAEASRRRLAIAAIAAGLVLTACLSAGRFIDLEVTVFRFFVVWLANSWVLLPVLAVLLALPRRTTVRAGFLALAAAVAAIVAWSLVSRFFLGKADVSVAGNLVAFLQYSVFTSLLPVLLMLATGNRRLRAVAPMVLAATIVFAVGFIAGGQLLIRIFDVGWLRPLLLGSGAPILLPLALVAPLVGAVCWALLRRLARLYEAKAFSDVQFVTDAWWMLIAVAAAIEFGNAVGPAGYATALAFPLYRVAFELALRRQRIAARAPASRRLLLLRVFGEAAGRHRSSERLFDEVVQRWRFHGSVQLIGAKDLASRTLDPGDLLRFVEGRVGDQFVMDGEDLARRLREMDLRPDPDGRYRVNEFFCFDDTWRPTLQALLERSDAVLMDLRGFTRQNSGCIFELQQIAAGGALGRTVLVTGEGTDHALLESTLADALRAAPGASAAPRIVRLAKDSAAERGRVFAELLALEPDRARAC